MTMTEGSRATAPRVYYRGYVHVEKFAGPVLPELANEVHKMFRRANIKQTRELHPLFARGSEEPLSLTLFPNRLEARTVGKSGSRDTATVLDANLSKVLACGVSKSKLLIFLSRPGSSRLHTHCFCLPSRGMTQHMATALGAIGVSVLQITDKTHRRTRSMPAISLAVSPAAIDRERSSSREFLADEMPAALARYSTCMDLSFFDDSLETGALSCATSGASSLRASVTTLHLMPDMVESLNDDSTTELDRFGIETSTDEELAVYYTRPRGDTIRHEDQELASYYTRPRGDTMRQEDQEFAAFYTRPRGDTMRRDESACVPSSWQPKQQDNEPPAKPADVEAEDVGETTPSWMGAAPDWISKETAPQEFFY